MLFATKLTIGPRNGWQPICSNLWWCEAISLKVAQSELRRASVSLRFKCCHSLIPWTYEEWIFIFDQSFKVMIATTEVISVRDEFLSGGGGAEVSCPNIFAIPCTKFKWFCPNITRFFFFLLENGYLKNSGGAAASSAPSAVRLWLKSKFFRAIWLYAS